MNAIEKQIEFRRLASNGDLQGINRMLDKSFPVPKGALSVAAGCGRIDVMRRLLAAGDYPKDNLGELASSLCDAISNKEVEAVRFLLDAGARPDSGSGRFLDYPALLIAARKGMAEVVKLLLERGANPNAHDIPAGADLLGMNVAETALMAAALKGDQEIVRLLLTAGADPSIRGAKCKTAFELVARRKDRKEVAAILRDWKLKPKARTRGAEKESLPLKLGQPVLTWREAIAFLKDFSGKSPVSHPRSKAIQVFSISADLIRKHVRRVKGLERPIGAADISAVIMFAQKKCAMAKATIFLCLEVGEVAICAAPWKDKFKTISALKCGSANYGVKTANLIALLKKIEARWPFELVECGAGAIGGKFLNPVACPKELCGELLAICPLVLEDFNGKPCKFEHDLAKTGVFKLWWN
jgi:hypothetical protein